MTVFDHITENLEQIGWISFFAAVNFCILVCISTFGVKGRNFPKLLIPSARLLIFSACVAFLSALWNLFYDHSISAIALFMLSSCAVFLVAVSFRVMVQHS